MLCFKSKIAFIFKRNNPQLAAQVRRRRFTGEINKKAGGEEGAASPLRAAPSRQAL
jgi:hypothetical protein